jgi:TonB-linked SusC/RagA family outer membrane protein
MKKNKEIVFQKAMQFLLLLLVFSLPVSQQVCAQNAHEKITIKGKVIDENNQPVASASITVKGKITGVTADANGFFSIEVEKGDILVISYLEKSSKEIVVEKSTSISIMLTSSDKQLEEVVVTALGITKEKRKIGFATQEVKGVALEKAREPNILSSLNGRVAGLTISNSTTLFENIGLSLRGRTPLIVIDGIPTRGDSWNLNSDDIESISVLKSNAAALLYGSLGNNGAVQITTKRGMAGANGVEISFNQTVQFQAGWIKIPDPQRDYGMGWNGYYAFIDGRGGGGWYDNYGYVWGPKLNQKDPNSPSGWLEVPQYNSPYDPSQSFQFRQSGYTGYSNYKPIPWITRGENNLKNFLNNEMLSTTNLSVAGKSDKGDYRISVTHLYQKGQIPNTKLNSTTLQLSGGMNLNEKLRMEGFVSYNRQYTPNFPVTGYGPSNFFYNILLWMGPDVDVRDLRNYWKPNRTNLEQFNYNYTWYNNPYYMANENLRGYNNDVVVSQARINYDVTKNLNISLRSGGTINNVTSDLKTPYSFVDYTAAPFGQYSTNSSSNLRLNSDLIITYKQKFLKDLDVTVSAGGANRYEQSKALNSSTAGGLQVPLTYNLGNSRSPVTSTNSLSELEVKSVFGYTDIGYKNWVNLNVSVRNDWTSSLKKPFNSFFYPSASLGLIVSEMMRMPSFISFTKLRGAYADVSSDPGAYFTIPTYTRGTRWNGIPSLSLPGSIYDPAIKPSRTISKETGLEMKFLKNRFGFDFTYFSYLDKNSIRNVPLSQASGYSNLIVNGDIYTRNGIEVVLTGTPIKTKNITWNLTANFTRLREKVKEYYGGATERNGIKVGERRDVYRGYAWEKSPDGQIVHDANGMPQYINQLVNLGFTGDDWSFGFISELKYKNFSFSFIIDGRIGGKIYNGVESKMYEGGMHKKTANSFRDDAYAGKDTYLSPGVIVTSGSVTYDVQGNIISDNRKFAANTTKVNYIDWVFTTYTNGIDEAVLYDKTFVKLREAIISYNFSPKIIKKTPFKSANLSAVGRNLLIITKVPFMDPDGYSGLSLAEPSYRNIGINLNLKF